MILKLESPWDQDIFLATVYVSGVCNITGFAVPELRNHADTLSWVVLAILLFLVFLNALLYYKLWTLEAWAQDSSQSFTVMDLQVLRHPPKSHDEWLQLLQQQEALHNVEMHKWQKVLQAAVQLLRQVSVQIYILKQKNWPIAW